MVEKNRKKMNIHLLDAGSLGDDMDLSIFSELGNCSIWKNTSERELEERTRNADVIVSNRILLGEEELRRMENLKLICLTATGFNTVDTAYCRTRGIGVSNVAGYSTESVAQHTFAMLLYLMEHSRYYDDYIREGRFRKDSHFADVSNPWNEISGKSWGIIGLGAIGKRVASIAEAFGARVSYFSTSGIERKEPWPRVSLEELLRDSDIISIHAPLNRNTENLLSHGQFHLMKKNAILLNLGRGAIIDEDALVTALEEGMIQSAGLDVLKDEPPGEDSRLPALVKQDKLFITPHNAWGSRESRIRLIREVAENIKAFLEGRLRNRIV